MHWFGVTQLLHPALLLTKLSDLVQVNLLPSLSCSPAPLCKMGESSILTGLLGNSEITASSLYRAHVVSEQAWAMPHTHLTVSCIGSDLEARESEYWGWGGGFLQDRLWEKCGFLELLSKG